MTNELIRTGQVALTDLPLSAAAVALLGHTSNAGFAADDFFKASISNEHTRRAYGRIVDRFLNWCDERGLVLHNITPGLAGEYMHTLEGSAATKNQALAAMRHFFDALVTRHAVPLNSVASVRRRQAHRDGRQNGRAVHRASAETVRLDRREDAMGLRDRAILGRGKDVGENVTLALMFHLFNETVVL